MVERVPASTGSRPGRRSPALASRLLVAAAAVAATAGLVGWMGRAAGAAEESEALAVGPTVTIRRFVVVEPRPEPEPYIVLEAAPAGRVVTVVTQPARVVRRASAATTTQSAPAPVTTSSGS